LEDQVTGLRCLGEQFPELDMARVGIFGWSFGGYLSAMAVMRRPDIFHAAVCGAPVTDFREYDTHYTERYLGLPQVCPEAYDVSSIHTYASRLQRPILIIHGTADDNCCFSGSLRLSDTLFRAGIDHEFLPLRGEKHMVTNPDVVFHLYKRLLLFFKRHLV
jgi:dipeptidyl-peptidase-4